MSGSISTGDFAREHLQDARRRVYSSLPKNLSENLSKALGATWWLLEIVRNIQTEHTKNPVLTVLTQNQICVQSAELLRELISEAEDAVAPVLDEIRLAAADKDIVSFGKVSGVTAFDTVLKEADRTLAAVEAAKIREDELVGMLSSFFPLPPIDKEWNSLRAQLEKESMRASSRRSKREANDETDNGLGEAAREGNSQPQSESKSEKDASEIIETFQSVMLDKNGIKILKIAEDNQKPSDQRMREITDIDPRHAGNNSLTWGGMLGVTPAAIRKNEYWKELKKDSKNLD